MGFLQISICYCIATLNNNNTNNRWHDFLAKSMKTVQKAGTPSPAMSINSSLNWVTISLAVWAGRSLSHTFSNFWITIFHYIEQLNEIIFLKLKMKILMGEWWKHHLIITYFPWATINTPNLLLTEALVSTTHTV